MNKICVVGAGNIGVACAVELASDENNTVILFSKKANQLCSSFKKIDMDTNDCKVSSRIIVTDNSRVAFSGSEIIFVTLPSFLIQSFVEEISLFSPKIVYYIPGYGGKELYSQKLIKKGIVIAGLERVPFIARLNSPTVVHASKKNCIACATLLSSDTEYACDLIERLLEIPCERVNNYLTITFTPSNPILHTSRLFSMFENLSFESLLPSQIKFYAEWTDYSSEILINMDQELEMIIARISGMNLTQFRTIRTHYESFDVNSMTKKIKSIKAFQNILSPLIEVDNGCYCIDSKSRYFQEDFMFGLIVLKSFAEVLSVDTPCMDKVLRWYEKISGKLIFNLEKKLDLKSLQEFPLIQNFGINNLADIQKFYG